MTNQSFFEDNELTIEDNVDEFEIVRKEEKPKKYKNLKDKIEQEWLIKCLAMGISEIEFWSLNPHKIKLRIEAKKMEKEEEDYKMWMQGYYNMCGVAVALSNAFGGKAKYLEEPLSKSNKELSEEEKIEKTKELFKTLEIMQSNFELSHKNENSV